MEVHKYIIRKIDNMDYISLGKNIRKYRIQAGYTQSHLAELCDCTDGHIGQIENARSIPSLSITLSIANALNVSVDQLVSEDLTNKENFLNTRIYELTKNLSTTDKIFALEMIEALLAVFNKRC